MAVNTLTLYMPGSSVGIQVYEGSQLHLILVSQGANSIPSAPGETVRADPFPQYVDDDELAAALAGVGGGGATDAELRDRSTHTGTQTAATISDLREQVEDYVAALLGAGTNVTLTYTDNGEGAGSLAIAATGGTTDPEAVRDAIGIALIGAGLISVAVNDAGDTITISTTATANSTDAQLRDRSTHTGSQAISTVTGLQAALDAKAARALAKRAITGAYTLVAADATDVVLHSTAAAAVTVTLPQDSAATIAQEIAIPWRQYDAGQITFAAGTGATLISRGSVFKSAGQYAEGLVTKVAANTWLLSGDISA